MKRIQNAHGSKQRLASVGVLVRRPCKPERILNYSYVPTSVFEYLSPVLLTTDEMMSPTQ
jgi:hypothetical protein